MRSCPLGIVVGVQEASLQPVYECDLSLVSCIPKALDTLDADNTPVSFGDAFNVNATINESSAVDRKVSSGARDCRQNCTGHGQTTGGVCMRYEESSSTRQ
jgi:hypothetical protein